MYPVLYLDTLKVSTIEQTAENAEARGGKGNPALISWDYNKEINVTLEDALFSAKSMAIMFGNGYVSDIADKAIMKTEYFTCTSTINTLPTQAQSVGSAADPATLGGWNQVYTAPDGKKYVKYNPKFYSANENGANRDAVVKLTKLEKDKVYFCTYDLKVAGTVIDVSANSFPGTYYVTGDTYARNEASGDDEFFQFIIPKAKVTSENTITMEAEGDPSVFSMSLRVLRPADGVMMKLVKYNLEGGADADAQGSTSNVIHNHYLEEEEEDGTKAPNFT